MSRVMDHTSVNIRSDCKHCQGRWWLAKKNPLEKDDGPTECAHWGFPLAQHEGNTYDWGRTVNSQRSQSLQGVSLSGSELSPSPLTIIIISGILPPLTVDDFNQQYLLFAIGLTLPDAMSKDAEVDFNIWGSHALYVTYPRTIRSLVAYWEVEGASRDEAGLWAHCHENMRLMQNLKPNSCSIGQHVPPNSYRWVLSLEYSHVKSCTNPPGNLQESDGVQVICDGIIVECVWYHDHMKEVEHPAARDQDKIQH